MFVKATEIAAVAAAHSVDPGRWWTEFSAVIDRIAPRFARYEPLRHAAELMAGMVSGLDSSNESSHSPSQSQSQSRKNWH